MSFSLSVFSPLAKVCNFEEKKKKEDPAYEVDWQGHLDGMLQAIVGNPRLCLWKRNVTYVKISAKVSS